MELGPRKLVADERMVSAIGGGYGTPAKVLELALERGINYFFWGPVFPTYWKMAKWLREKFKKDREKIILATVTYFWKIPGSLERTIHRHLKWLGTDYIDYFHLGMLRSDDRAALDDLVRFKERGLIRHLAFSSHQRKLAAELAQKWPVDLAMIRYNAANRGAETEFFPKIAPGKISVVAFNATRHGSLLKAEAGWTGNKPVPSAADCYRFVLSHPQVTMCLAGPRQEKHIKEIFSALEKGPMTEDELKWMREFGDLVYGKK